MAFDFSALNELAKTSHQKPPEAEISEEDILLYNEPSKGRESLTEGERKLQREIDNKNSDIWDRVRVYKTYQENIKRSSQLQTEIMKGLKNGESTEVLFLKAMEAISCMTDNKVLYTIAKSTIEGNKEVAI